MRRWLLLGAALPLAVAAAPRRAAPPAAEARAILERIERRGPKAVLDELYSSESRWRPVMEGIASGQAAWLQVASRLRPVARPVAQELTAAVARALEREPANVLAILDRSFDADDVCSLNTIEDTLGSDFTAALHTVSRREKAVAGVADPALADRRESCLAFLDELKREVVRNREEWFVSR